MTKYAAAPINFSMYFSQSVIVFPLLFITLLERSCARRKKLLPLQQFICFPAVASQISKCLMWLCFFVLFLLQQRAVRETWIHCRLLVKPRHGKTDYNHSDVDSLLIILGEKQKCFSHVHARTRARLLACA